MTSVLTQTLARLLLAPILVVAVAVLVKGYADVGDGFAAGLVAALALVSSAAVLWLEAQDDFDVRAEVALEATPNAPDAAGELRLGERDASGTWPLELTVSGLRELPPGDFYVLWLAKDGKYAGTCGSFRVTGGKTTHRWDVAYRLHDYDEWVISARHPGLPTDPRLHPWLLHARI